VLEAWTASPARFREDANAEEDLALGGYRDRLLVELAQNAADAARLAGVPGVLRLALEAGVLIAANTGAPLDAAGVQALSSLRASAKRDADSVGRFGVGFAAVLAVSEEPAVLSRTGGVLFSSARTRAGVASVPALAQELRRRGRAVPVLRLPWPAEGEPPPGFDTAVRLPLRDGALPRVQSALAELDATLLLALPGLQHIEVGQRVLSRTDLGGGHVLLRDGDRQHRWATASATGRVDPALLADRPVEERARDTITVSWAVPVDAAGAPEPLPTPQVVHAPTPSDEPLSLPARLIATLPLDPSRRRAAPGPLLDTVARTAGQVYAELLAGLVPTPAVLALVPRPGLAGGQLDAGIVAAALAAAREAPLLPRIAGRPGRGADSAVVDLGPAAEQAAAQLAEVVPGLLPPTWWRRSLAPALRALGVRRLSPAEVVDAVAGVRRDPAWWCSLYAGLADVADREALAGLPVPLADGRTVAGARGLLLPGGDVPAAAVAVLGLRVVHPDAVHPLLERLGATTATPRALLSDARLLDTVAASYDQADQADLADQAHPAGEAGAAGQAGLPGAVAEAVLALVAAADLAPGEVPELAELALPGRDGETYPAGELLLPAGVLASVVDADAPFGIVTDELVGRWGEPVLEAVGVLRTFAVVRETDWSLAEAEHDLDGEQEWIEDSRDRLPASDVPPLVEELVAVRDLELVHPDRWEAALAALATPPLRSAVTTPAPVRLPHGGTATLPSYTSWWLARHAHLGGQHPRDLCLPGAADLEGLYDEAPGEDLDWLAAIGCRGGVDDVLAEPGGAPDLLDRLADPARTVPDRVLRLLYGRIARALDAADLPWPMVTRVRVGPRRVVPAADVVVLDAPWVLPLLDGREVVPAASADAELVADLLDVPLASEQVPRSVDPAGHRRLRWADVPGVELAAHRLGADRLPATTVAVYDDLRVGGAAVDWWPGQDVDCVAAAAGAAALGRALAWRLGSWERRAAAVEALSAPQDERRLRAEDAAGSGPGG